MVDSGIIWIREQSPTQAIKAVVIGPWVEKDSQLWSVWRWISFKDLLERVSGFHYLSDRDKNLVIMKKHTLHWRESPSHSQNIISAADVFMYLVATSPKFLMCLLETTRSWNLNFQ